MMDFFYETEDIFMLKNVEKRCAKEKGISAMSIKDILQSLVDDNMVCCERIGTSNYYWAFPSQGANVRKIALAKLEAELEQEELAMQALSEELQQAQTAREAGSNRSDIMAARGKLLQREQALESELAMYASCDPTALKEKALAANTAFEAANRWTDNIFNVRTWCNKKFNIETKSFDKNFGLGEDFDYLEEEKKAP